MANRPGQGFHPWELANVCERSLNALARVGAFARGRRRESRAERAAIEVDMKMFEVEVRSSGQVLLNTSR